MRKRTTLITNAILSVALIFTVAVSFLPAGALPSYGGKDVKAIYKGENTQNVVSLSFNVYEGADVVLSILKVLEEHNAKATFFVGGCWADDNGDTLKKIAESGNELANHGYFHKDHAKLGEEGNRQEIYLTGVIVNAFTGVTPNLFAPPSGSYSDVTVKVASELGYRVIMWSKDTIDWRDDDINKIISRATKDLSSGDIILMHPKKHTLAALPEILSRIEKGGFAVRTVTENIDNAQ